MKKLLIVLAAGAMLALGTQAANANLVIDDFDAFQELTATPSDTPKMESISAATGIMGLERDSYIANLGGDLGANLTMNANGNGLLNFNVASDTDGMARIQWDGDSDSSEVLNPTGLGEIDLTDGGYLNALGLGIVFDDLPASITMTVFTDAANWSELTFGTTGGTFPPGYKESLLFESFVIGAGAGADFTKVGAIQLEINSLYPATDLQIDFLDVHRVPEPCAAVLGVVGLGLVTLRRRK